ncbi:MAG: hypothetical protein HAW66_09465 [Shewanella sp.]|nr:hypothetical protein [Shewanella sp.]
MTVFRISGIPLQAQDYEIPANEQTRLLIKNTDDCILTVDNNWPEFAFEIMQLSNAVKSKLASKWDMTLYEYSSIYVFSSIWLEGSCSDPNIRSMRTLVTTLCEVGAVDDAKRISEKYPLSSYAIIHPTCDKSLLDSHDLQEVVEFISNSANNNSDSLRVLGGMLGLVESCRAETVSVEEIATAWIEQKERVTQRGRACWHSLAIAMSNSGNTRIAHSIRERHPEKHQTEHKITQSRSDSAICKNSDSLFGAVNNQPVTAARSRAKVNCLNYSRYPPHIEAQRTDVQKEFHRRRCSVSESATSAPSVIVRGKFSQSARDLSEVEQIMPLPRPTSTSIKEYLHLKGNKNAKSQVDLSASKVEHRQKTKLHGSELANPPEIRSTRGKQNFMRRSSIDVSGSHNTWGESSLDSSRQMSRSTSLPQDLTTLNLSYSMGGFQRMDSSPTSENSQLGVILELPDLAENVGNGQGKDEEHVAKNAHHWDTENIVRNGREKLIWKSRSRSLGIQNHMRMDSVRMQNEASKIMTNKLNWERKLTTLDTDDINKVLQGLSRENFVQLIQELSKINDCLFKVSGNEVTEAYLISNFRGKSDEEICIYVVSIFPLKENKLTWKQLELGLRNMKLVEKADNLVACFAPEKLI